MKRIICFIDNINYGGAERQFVEMVALLKKAGYSVQVLFYEKTLFYDGYLKNENINFHRIEYKGKGLRKYLGIIKETNAIIKDYKPDVVISYLRLPNIIACLLKNHPVNYKLIVSERNTTQSLSRLERLKFWAFKKADVIVPNSHAQEQFIKCNYPKLLQKIHVITNCVDTIKFAPAIQKCFDNDTFSIICVARIKEQKNLVRFIHMIDKLRKDCVRKFSVTWYGEVNDDYGKQCVALIKTLGIGDIFTIKSPIKDIQLEYQKADALCLPSIYEGFPNVIGEAMSCGLPILCSDVCDNATLVDHTNGRLFNPFDEDDMMNVTKAFLSLKKEEYEAMGKASREKAESILSKEAFIKKYTDIIES